MMTNSNSEIWREWWVDMRNSSRDISANEEHTQAPASAYIDPPIVTGLPVDAEVIISNQNNQPTQIPIVSVPMVEVEEISPEGWFCLIAGCFFCPGFNLFGLCMREKRLVPADTVILS